MIARMWVGETTESNAEDYSKYLEETGGSDCQTTPGNRGVYLLRRLYEGKAEFVFISFWDSLESIKAFAGPDYQNAVYYSEDTKFLLKLDPHVAHYEVILSPSD
jgi:heme-degrading monooxygenase HmoA